MIPTPRPFQADVIERVAQAAGAPRCARVIVLQAATGSGKTVTACHVVRRAVAKASPVLWMVHRRRLVDQASDELTRCEVNHGILMRGETTNAAALVQVASRDTLLSRCVRHEWVGLPPAKLVIVDEAHHAANPESEYRRILEQYPSAVVLLLTATPVGPDGKGMGPWAQALVCAAPTSQLVRDGYLCPVKVFAPDRKRGKVKRRGVAGGLVASWEQYAEGRPTVLFCSRVKHSQDAVESFRAAGITAAHLDADTPDDERDRVFDDVAAGRIKVVSNVGIVGEGVDVPELGCCQLFCEVGGRVRFLQACGRIMRPAPGKEYGVLIDHAGAVFRHGFPDEDTDWSLEGNADEAFAAKHKDGGTEAALYCKHCELVYHGTACPQCGRQPVKPPRSVFAPPPQETTSELLTEAERSAARQDWTREEQMKHWLRCLGVAAARNGTFAMARVIYKQKYKEWPGDDFPCQCRNWKARVADVYPNFRRRRAAQPSQPKE